MPGDDRPAGRRRVMSSVVSGASFFAAETSRERLARGRMQRKVHSIAAELNWTELSYVTVTVRLLARRAGVIT